MFDKFSHFIAYGSTDQETLRELTPDYNGLLVPGTVAAYQSEGTRGFVLSLSASANHPYAIDPRTPLFQYFNSSPKQSHISLARVLGVESEFTKHGMIPPHVWTKEYCESVAKAWVSFNSDYTRIAPKQFDKYARRLGRKLPLADAQLPRWVLPPYLMHTSHFDPSKINDRLWAASVAAVGGDRSRLRRVVAATSASNLQQDAVAAGEKEIVVWMDNLDEVDQNNEERLASYALSISNLNKLGIKPFALYGGYFAVALSTVGLHGASHGVGFSEHRNHIELKTSGGAPARFYVQRLHRYLPIDIASELWRQNSGLVVSYYPGYVDRDPGEYTYHDLMKHSVRARADEVRRVSGLLPNDVAISLNNAFKDFQTEFGRVTISPPVARRVQASIMHLPMWARALAHL